MSLLLTTILALATPASSREFPELELSLTLPPLQELQSVRDSESLTIDRGELLGHRIEIATHVLTRRRFSLETAEDLTDLFVTSLRARGRTPVCSHDLVEPSYRGFWERAAGRAMAVRFQRSRLVPGPYGIDPFAAELEGEIQAEPTHWPPGGSLHLKGAVLAEAAYLIEVSCSPPARGRVRDLLRAFLDDGVRYTGPVRDPLWSREEILERWRDCLGDPAADSRVRILRTEHYIIAGDASFGRSLGRSLERTYDRVRATLPFPEWPGRRLMPVFLFRRPADFQRFAAREGGGNRGFAWGDAFATWYESPADPVLVHEAVHQLLANRLRLQGGGSWFQEGMAEYLSRATWERTAEARRIDRQGFAPLDQLVRVRRLSKDGSHATVRERYAQAGLLIEHLHDTSRGPDEFRELVVRVGSLPPGDVGVLEDAMADLRGQSLTLLEERWLQSLRER